jgi:hypothetical protein
MKSSLLALVAAAVVVLAVGGAARATGSAPAARLAEATMIVESTRPTAMPGSRSSSTARRGSGCA